MLVHVFHLAKYPFVPVPGAVTLSGKDLHRAKLKYLTA
jgi:hypothetical protein